MFFVSLLTLAATLSLIRFWLFPEIDQFRHQLETTLSDRLHHPVHIQKLRASLYQFKPQLRLLGITIGDSDSPLRLREIQVVVNTFTSLEKRHLAIESIRLVGASIEVERTMEGKIKIRGLGNGNQGFPSWLLQDGKIELIKSTLRWHFPSQTASNPLPIWHNVQILLVNHGEEHQLAISFHAPTRGTGQGWLHLHFVGDLQNLEEGQGHFLFGLQDIRLLPFQGILSPLLTHGQWMVSQGHGNMDIIGKWQRRKIEARMGVSLEDIQLQRTNPAFSVSIQRFDASAYVQWTPQGWSLNSPYLRVMGRGVDIASRISLIKTSGRDPDLDIFSLVNQLDLAPLTAQFPIPTNPKLVKWIAMQPFKGSLTGRFLWRGKLSDYPFKLHDGIAEASLHGHDLTIRFLPNWPVIEQADIHLHLLDDKVQINLAQAGFGGIAIGPATGGLELAVPDPTLTIDTAKLLRISDVFTVLQQSPLKKAITNLTNHTDIDGLGNLAIHVDIPLLHARHTKIHGKAYISKASVTIKATPYVLTNLKGNLNFNRYQISTRLHGNYNHHPALMTAKASKQQSHVNVQTRFNANDLPDFIHMAQYLQGESDITVDLLKQGNRPVKISIQTDLIGTSVILPRPIGKPADSKRLLTLSAWLTGSDEISFTFDYEPTHAVFTFNKYTSQISGRIGLNQPPPSPAYSGKNGLIVQGHFERIDLLPWMKLVPKTTGQKTDPLTLKLLDISADHLMLGTKDLGNYRLYAQAKQGNWQGSIATPYGPGKWRSSIRQKQLYLSFERLNFHHLPTLNRASPIREESFSFTHWPTIQLNVLHLDYQNQDMGHLEIRTIAQQQVLNFDLKLSANTHRIEASGSWETHPSVRTQFLGHLTTPSLGDFLKRINHPTALVDTPAQIDFNLNWNAPPYNFSLDQLNGNMQLNLGPGRWLDVEPGAGRIFGLLYLGTLGRRLRLDFSDLFTTGISYDRITGHIRLADGRAFTDDLVIEAVPARIFISGTVDLGARRTDELITVIPNTPLTLGLLHQKQQTQLGKAASQLQRMINTPLDSITQSQYAITGTWDDPVIVRLRRSVPGAILHGIWSGFKNITGNHDTQ